MPRSRLLRAFGFGPGGYAFVIGRTGGRPVIRDDQIVSMTLTRGNGSITGASGCTAQVVIAGTETAIDFDSNTIDINLSDAAKAVIYDRCGYDREILGATVRIVGTTNFSTDVYNRWHGRLAGKTVDDLGDPRQAQWVTTLTCTDILQLVTANAIPAVATRTKPKIFDLVVDMIARSGIGIPYPTQDDTRLDNRVYFKTGDPDSKSIDPQTVVSHFVGDTGAMLYATRDGRPRLRGWKSYQDAAAKVDVFREYYWRIPIERRHVLRPVRWEQRIATPAGIVWKKWDGTEDQIMIGSPNPSVGRWPVEHLDMSDVYDDGLAWAMNARWFRSRRAGYVVDSMRFDVLDLLENGSRTDRVMLGYLLTIDQGSPVTIGTSWPPLMAGIYIATQITETITANSWIIELKVIPFEQAAGNGPVARPESTDWELGYPVWPAPLTWDELPATTEWDMAP